MKIHAKPDKFYVANGNVKVLVMALDPVQAVCEAISYLGFDNATDLAETMHNIFTDQFFIVDPRGFRLAYEVDKDSSYMSLGDAVKFFNDACNRFDPFCEQDSRASDEFYESLGDDENADWE
jgi:hypothetical protein